MPIEQLVELISRYGYAAIVALLTLGIVGLPVPDETLLTLTGFLIFRGTLQAIPAYLFAFLGTILGITLSFGIGRFGGLQLVHRFGPRLHITAGRLARVRKWFERNGKWALMAGYFVPGVRHLIAIVAGSTGLPYAQFALFAYTGGVVWSSIFVTAGFFLGKGWDHFPGYAKTAALVAAGSLVLAAGGYALVQRYRGRKNLRS